MQRSIGIELTADEYQQDCSTNVDIFLYIQYPLVYKSIS